MGNQHELQQVHPYRCLGVLLPVRAGVTEQVRTLLTPDGSRFYTHLEDAHTPITIINLDGPDTVLGPFPHATISIQSGGKMWCGYDRFITWIATLAPLVDDAQFYIGDSEDFIDAFQIQAGGLDYARVHHGWWRSLDGFFEEQGIPPLPAPPGDHTALPSGLGH